MGRIFCIMGKSSSGKDTIFKKLKDDEEINLKTVIPYTTRPMRANEEDGREYFFRDKDFLDKLYSEDNVIECRTYNTIHGDWHYFTANDGQINLDNNSYIIIGTLEVYNSFIKYYGNDKVVPIYIEVEDGERLRRALSRESEQDNPKYAEMCRRYLADENDFCEDNILRAGIMKRYDNYDINKCIKNIKKDINSFS